MTTPVVSIFLGADPDESTGAVLAAGSLAESADVAVAIAEGRPAERAGLDVSDEARARLDAIVANPPYVVDRAAPALQPEVRDYEPALALFGGSEGFDLVTRLVAEAPSRLRPGGHLVFEFGLGQDVEVEELLEQAPDLTLLEMRRDLQGIARTAVAQRR